MFTFLIDVPKYDRLRTFLEVFICQAIWEVYNFKLIKLLAKVTLKPETSS